MTGDPMKPTVPQTSLDSYLDPPVPPKSVWDHIKAALPKNWQQIVMHLLMMALMAIAAKYGIPLMGPTEPLPLPVWEQQIEQEHIPALPAPDKTGLNMGVDWTKIKTRVACACCRCDEPKCKCKDKP